MPHLTVIIITHNRLEYSKRTLSSLVASVPQADFVIYDNDSTEAGMKDWLRSLQFEPIKAKIIIADDNVGWGEAVNYALTHANTAYVLISNNDVVYEADWFAKCLELYNKYPQIGVLGVWKHSAHGIKQDMGDMLIKDDMPAVGWLMQRIVLDDIGPFAQRGPCVTKGGNGEDTNYTGRAIEKGYWVCGPKNDVAVHLDGY